MNKFLFKKMVVFLFIASSTFYILSPTPNQSYAILQGWPHFTERDAAFWAFSYGLIQLQIHTYLISSFVLFFT